VDLKTVEFLLQPSYLVPVYHHVGVTASRLSHYLIDDELRGSADVKSLNPKFCSDVQTIH
jgi:hypothetical protein